VREALKRDLEAARYARLPDGVSSLAATPLRTCSAWPK
jgi:hypothetical protein